MAEFTLTRTIQSPPARVYQLATDLAALHEIIPAITRVEVVSPGPNGRFGVGTRWRETRKSMGKEMTVELWVSACDPGRSFTVDAEVMNTHYASKFEFTTSADGRETDATLRCVATPRTFGGRVMAALTKGTMAKGMRGDLDCLAKAAESPGQA